MDAKIFEKTLNNIYKEIFSIMQTQNNFRMHHLNDIKESYAQSSIQQLILQLFSKHIA